MIDIKAPAWKQIWKPVWVKVGVPGHKYLGKDNDGWEYVSHDLWKKKLVWKPQWQKVWVPSHKTIWVSQSRRKFEKLIINGNYFFRFLLRNLNGSKDGNRSGKQPKN